MSAAVTAARNLAGIVSRAGDLLAQGGALAHELPSGLRSGVAATPAAIADAFHGHTFVNAEGAELTVERVTGSAGSFDGPGWAYRDRVFGAGHDADGTYVPISGSGHASTVGDSSHDNEDAVIRGHAMTGVADGVSTLGGGDDAARITAETLLRHEDDIVNAPTTNDARRELAKAVAEARSAVERTTDGASTLNLSVMRPDGTMLIHNTGDSQAWHVHADGSIEQITTDQNGAMMVPGRHGALRRVTLDHDIYTSSPEHPVIRAGEQLPDSYLLNAIGGGDHGEVGDEIKVIRPEAGSYVVHVSDGVTKVLSQDEIAEVLRTARTPQDAAEELVRRADGYHNSKGYRSPDNISAAVAKVGDVQGVRLYAGGRLAGTYTDEQFAHMVHQSYELPTGEHDASAARPVLPAADRPPMTDVQPRAASFGQPLQNVPIAQVTRDGGIPLDRHHDEEWLYMSSGTAKRRNPTELGARLWAAHEVGRDSETAFRYSLGGHVARHPSELVGRVLLAFEPHGLRHRVPEPPERDWRQWPFSPGGVDEATDGWLITEYHMNHGNPTFDLARATGTDRGYSMDADTGKVWFAPGTRTQRRRGVSLSELLALNGARLIGPNPYA
jgi:serine/threonine protein phosphatase PrpC